MTTLSKVSKHPDCVPIKVWIQSLNSCLKRTCPNLIRKSETQHWFEDYLSAPPVSVSTAYVSVSTSVAPFSCRVAFETLICPAMVCSRHQQHWVRNVAVRVVFGSKRFLHEKIKALVLHPIVHGLFPRTLFCTLLIHRLG